MTWFEKIAEKYALWIFIAVGFILYFYSLFNGFVGDDFDQVVNNTFMQNIFHLPYFFLGGTFNNGFSDLSGIYYKPLLTICFSLIYTAFGTTSFFYHLTQLVLHIANTILCFYLFQKFFSKTVSFFAAFVFLIHPINTESVVYVSGMQEVLFLFFGLLGMTLLVYKKHTVTNFLIIHILFLLSVLSKETGIVFFGVSLWYGLLYCKKEILKQCIYLFAVGGLYAALRIHAVGIYSYHHELFPMMQLTLWQRFVNIPQIFVYYLRTFVFPLYLAFDQNWVVRHITFFDFFLPLGITAGFLITLLWVGIQVKKEKYSKSFYFFAGWFFIGLLLHLQIIPLDSTVADRWFYFPIIGLLGMLSIVFLHWKSRFKRWAEYSFLTVLGIFFVLTFSRSLNWQNQYVLYGHDVSYNKDSYTLLNGWGSELMSAGKYTEAEPFVRQSIDLEPRFCYSWNNLGSIYAQKQEFTKARTYYEKALEGQACPMAYNNLATLLYYHASEHDAYTFTTNALKKVKESPRLWLMVALLEHKKGKKDAALFAAKRSYLLSPSSAAAYVYTHIQNNQPFELKEF